MGCIHPPPTSANGSLCSPAVASSPTRGEAGCRKPRLRLRQCGATSLPLPMWERMASSDEAKSSSGRLVRGNSPPHRLPALRMAPGVRRCNRSAGSIAPAQRDRGSPIHPSHVLVRQLDLPQFPVDREMLVLLGHFGKFDGGVVALAESVDDFIDDHFRSGSTG